MVVNDAKRKPNIVFIFPDTVTYDRVGIYSGKVKTPNIDRIFENGMRFNHASPNSPLCSPARYNVLTGRYTSRCPEMQKLYTENDPEFIRWNVYLTDKEKSIVHAFKENDYITGMIGKWHLGEAGLEQFDENEKSTDPEVLGKVKRNYNKSKEYIKAQTGFDYAECLMTNNENAIPMPVDIPCQHNVPWMTKGALDFIGENQDNPFFLYYAPNVPHVPDVLDTLKSGALLTPAGFLEEELDVQPSYANVLKRLEELGFPAECEPGSPERAEKEEYARMMWLDDGIGAIIDKLEELNLMDDTIIIFNTDHLAKSKMTCYRERIPLAFQWSNRIEAGSSCDRLVSHVDLASTMLDLCELELPEGLDMDGKSFRDLLFAPDQDWENFVFTEIAYSRGILTKDWNYVSYRLPENIEKFFKNNGEINQEGLDNKLTRYNADVDFPGYFDRDQLYYYPEDKKEKNNLAYDPEHQLQLLMMKRKLADISAKFPFTYGEFKQNHHEKGDIIIRRGQRTYIYICESCGHIIFGKDIDACSVCGTSNNEFVRDDAIFYKAEEIQAVSINSHIPDIKIEKTFNESSNNDPILKLEIKIGKKEHHLLDSHTIEFIDIYKDGIFFQREKVETGSSPIIKLKTEIDFETLTVVSKCNKHGYWQREVLVK